MRHVPSTIYIVLLLGAAPGLALDPRQSLDQYVQRRWTSDEGLPQNAVHAILQTADGYLWIGTQEGLVRFDGVSFRTFDRQNTLELGSSFITALSHQEDGAIWIGTGGGGLTRYLEGRFQTYMPREGLPHHIVNALAVDGSGTLWIATDEGLGRFSGGRFATLRARDGLAGDATRMVSTGRGGTVWALTNQGISRFHDGRWSSYGVPAVPGQDASFLLQDRAGRVWVGTNGGEIFMIDGARSIHYGRTHGLTGERVTSMLEDRDGNLWVGTSSGLHRLAGDRFEMMSPTVGPVLSLFEDREGSLWVGTDGGGLLQLRSARLLTFSTRQGLPKDNVLSIHQDPRGALWVGTYGGGVVRFEQGKVTGTWTVDGGLASNDITSIHSTADGVLWAGTMRRGLSRIEGGRVRSDPSTAALASEEITSLLADRAGRLWIGTGRGLYVLDRGVLAHYGKEAGLTDPVVFALEEGREGDIWVGTRGGLAHLRDGRFIDDTATRALRGVSIMSIHGDEAGDLWVGTYARGLHWIHGDQHFAFKARHGLFNETVFHVLEDDAGNLWMSCNKGIFSASKSELLRVARGDAPRIACVVYGKGEGMRAPEGNGASQPGAWRTRDGWLWFPTVGGAVAINPREALGRRNTLPPSVHIEEVRGDGSPFTTRGLVRVPPGRGQLEIRYVGVSFVSPEKISYRYRLDGFDTEWVDAGTRRIAYYTNLPPGEYRFRVMAANSDGVWSEVEASVGIALAAHFHQTVWFRALLALLVIASGWGLHLLRNQQVRARSAVLAERNRLAREIHDGLAQSLTGVVIQIDAALGYLPQAPNLAEEHLERARRWARHSLAEARRAIWALRPSVTSVSALVEGLRRYAVLLTQESGARVEVRSPEDARLPPEVGAGLLRIGQEALTNAVRHGRPGRVWIDVRCSPDTLCLRLGDDGRGFDPRQVGEGGGLGLVGMRERAEALCGGLTIESTPGRGTEVVATLPLNRRGRTHGHGE